MSVSSYFVLTVSAFTEEPGPGPLRAPLGTQVQFTCSVTKSYRIEWSYLPPGEENMRSDFTTDTDGIEQYLRNRGITVERPSNTTSHLIVNGTEENSGSSFSCIAILTVTNRTASRPVEIIFYGMNNKWSNNNIHWIHLLFHNRSSFNSN